MNILTHGQSGVYAITNTINGHRYIGSSVNIHNRWMHHTSSLNKNCHRNAYLQSAWNKYGAACFRLSVLEFCDKALTMQREQFYIDTLRPDYNIAKDVIAPMRGTTLSDEHKAKISRGNKGYVKTEEHRKKLSESLMGHLFADETRQKMSAAQKKRFANTETTDELRAKRSLLTTLLWVKRRLEGYTMSDETKQKISKAHKGKPGHGKGISLSKEHRNKLSEAAKRYHEKKDKPR